jgi:hypothetical protein
VLEQQAVGGVRIDADLGIRNQAGHQMAELGWDHQVVIALDDQRRALDPGQPLQRTVVRDAPLDDRVVLRVSRRVGRRGVAPDLALHEAAEELPALGLAGIGVREHDVEEVLRLALAARGSGDVVAPAVHAGRALGTGCRQDEAPDERRPHERDLLRDEPADGEPEQVDAVEAERGDERDHLACRLGDRAARLAGRGPDAGVVDEDHLAVLSQCVGQRRIPVIEVPAEVLQHDKWQLGRSSETAVGELDAGRRDELRLGGGVGWGRGVHEAQRPGCRDRSRPWEPGASTRARHGHRSAPAFARD